MIVGLRGVGINALGLTAALLALTPSGLAAAEDAPAAKPAPALTLRLPDTPYRYTNLDFPPHFKTPGARGGDNTPNNNGLTDEGATLGRVLFYDTKMSANNTVACASCHSQKHAFADPQRFSKGFEGKFVDRHAMNLTNLRYYSRSRFFWDERAGSLEAQVLMPIQNKIEMGQDLGKLTQILAQDPNYPELFRQAFGSTAITRDRVAKALAQFVRSMVSYRSKYDVGMAKASSINDNFSNFSAQENQGKTLFLNRCANCHMATGQNAHFFMGQPLNNGLDASIKAKDGGVGDLTLQGADLGRFKSPSLRNVELTAPYMHDGRFATLEAVVDHYSTGVKDHPNLDRRVRRFNFNPSQKAALVAFMKTLTDREFITDPKYSDPFQ